VVPFSHYRTPLSISISQCLCHRIKSENVLRLTTDLISGIYNCMKFPNVYLGKMASRTRTNVGREGKLFWLKTMSAQKKWCEQINNLEYILQYSIKKRKELSILIWLWVFINQKKKKTFKQPINFGTMEPEVLKC